MVTVTVLVRADGPDRERLYDALEGLGLAASRAIHACGYGVIVGALPDDQVTAARGLPGVVRVELERGRHVC